MQAYAATEAAMFVSVLDKADHLPDNEHTTRRLSSAGRVTPGVEVYVADDRGRPLPPAETGEIMIRCRATVQGYIASVAAGLPQWVGGQIHTDRHSGRLLRRQ